MLNGGGANTTAKKKSKKEQTIDAKIEKLLVAYKKHDEDAKKKAEQLELDKVQGKRNLMEKFGFSDDEDLLA